MDQRAFSPRKPFLFKKKNSSPPSSKVKFFENFIWAPKIVANCLFCGAHSSFPILRVTPFMRRVHVPGTGMEARKKTKQNKNQILPNQIHQTDSSLFIGSAVHIASNATLCYCSVRAICITWHTEILCWKSRSLKQQQSPVSPASSCLPLLASANSKKDRHLYVMQRIRTKTILPQPDMILHSEVHWPF